MELFNHNILPYSYSHKYQFFLQLQHVDSDIVASFIECEDFFFSISRVVRKIERNRSFCWEVKEEAGRWTNGKHMWISRRVGRKTTMTTRTRRIDRSQSFPRSVPTRWIDPGAALRRAAPRPTYFLVALQCCTPRRRSAFAGEPWNKGSRSLVARATSIGLPAYTWNMAVYGASCARK